METCLVWHRRDLRVADNPALNYAAQNADIIIPVVCIEEAICASESPGNASVLTTQFKLECIADLRSQYRKLGSDLLVRVGTPEEILPRLAREIQATLLVYSKAHTQREVDRENEVCGILRMAGITTVGYWDDLLVDRASLPFELEHLPQDFSEFQQMMIEPFKNIPLPLVSPTQLPSCPLKVDLLPTLESLGFSAGATSNQPKRSFRGGTTEAMERVRSYIWNGGGLVEYVKARQSLAVTNYSSRLSPYLAHGAVSQRQFYAELARFEKKRVTNRSTRRLIGELVWRDFLRLTAEHLQSGLYTLGGDINSERAWESDMNGVVQWKRGQTGWPLVDACMRELSATGFISHAARTNVSSFLAQDLAIDWRMGAEHFDAQLVDADPCSNYCNWQLAAGVSRESEKHRRGIRQQSIRLDKSASYIKRWVPELKPLPPPTVHEMNGRDCSFETRAFGVVLGETYPKPISRSQWRYH